MEPGLQAAPCAYTLDSRTCRAHPYEAPRADECIQGGETWPSCPSQEATGRVSHTIRVCLERGGPMCTGIGRCHASDRQGKPSLEQHNMLSSMTSAGKVPEDVNIGAFQSSGCQARLAFVSRCMTPTAKTVLRRLSRCWGMAYAYYESWTGAN
ncbi:hypothetical protein VFPPC_17856 [Pochonia chlamydosporia 170]|uniref:Uncharacterized protein n=1 Tax=Pochonia chlamydosporia 170 TaxID=1380566 RepID=A0A219AQE8_METCM|nr:hypothetical protein VFPPC_17856 [Pochonia chlamydosporia 170]OWT42951.1 hypothetical protein VFPPC_17856 [Pochonia chlamydosporia 170]